MQPNNHESLVLSALPGTVPELVNLTGLKRGSVRWALKKLRAAKKAYIGGHQVSKYGGPAHPIYHAGWLDDVSATVEDDVPEDLVLMRQKLRAQQDIERLLAMPPQQWYSSLILEAA